jgi:hypothetical protein
VFHEGQEHAPSVLHFLPWAKGKLSSASVRGVPDNPAAVFSTTGMKHGDPLGPVLFALTLQGPLHRTATAHPATQIVATFKDINILGLAKAAALAFEALATENRAMGLHSVPSKSAAYSPDQT